MPTASVNLDTTQYVRVNAGYTSMILQAHNDSVRVVLSDLQPELGNAAYHTLGGGDAPLPFDIVNTNMWALAVSDTSSLVVTESDTSFATEETVSQLVMAVTNAIDETTYDLNAAAFNAVTNISNDYELDNVEFNFTTSESKTITITSADGTVILNESDNTDTSFIWQPSSEMAFNGGEQLTVDVTQFVSPGAMDCILKTKSGTNSLLGNPDVRVVDSLGNVYEDAIPSKCMPTIEIDHFFTHAGATFSCSGNGTIPALGIKYYHIKTGANVVHFIHYDFVSTLANADVILFEGPTLTDDGTPMSVYNKNRISSKTPTVQSFADPAISGSLEGTELEYDKMVGGKQSGGATFDEGGYEWVLPPNASYLLKYMNNANQDDDTTHKFVFLEPAQA